MKSFLLVASGLALVALSGAPATAQTLSPSLAGLQVYAPGTAYSVTEQPDGKRVVVGSFSRINGTAVPRLARFNADGSLDAAFNQNIGAAAAVYRAKLQSNGQYLLVAFSNSPLTVGGLTRAGGLLRLNANGTADASFDPGTGPSYGTGAAYLDDALPLANGQTLAVGYFEQFNGTTAHGIVRLNANGSVDPTFNQGSGADGEVWTIAPAPGGKFLIGGDFDSYNGYVCNGVARLNADGSFDTSFNAGLQFDSQIYNIKVQPNGSILLAGVVTSAASPTGVGLQRVLPSGVRDNTFTVPSLLSEPYGAYSYYGEAMEVQADGKILVKTNSLATPLVRLNTNGSIDASYQAIGDPNYLPYSITLLSSGKLAVPGFFTNFSGTLDRSLLQLNTDGSVDASWQPVTQVNGNVSAVARQADGKLLIGGSFMDINGQSARRLARLNTDGTLDGQFVFNTTSALDVAVTDLALQPDGRVVVASGRQLRRYLTNGSPDNSFAASLFPSAPTRVLVQPDGRVLVGGPFTQYGNAPVSNLVRLLNNGTYDGTFAPVTSGNNSLSAFGSMALQADGKLLVGGSFRNASGSSATRVVRLNFNGSVDASFTSVPFTTASGTYSPSNRFFALTLQPDGKLVAGGVFGAVNGSVRANLARLNADGTLDAGFTPPALTGTIYTLAVQPNNRVLVGGSFTSSSLPTNLARVLANGTADATFAATAVPNGSVRSLLIEPSGAVLAGGFFTTIGGQADMALARLIVPNVLHVAAPQAVADRTQAWPVPAQQQLTVVPDASAHAQALELLDALGRPVLRRTLSGAAPATLAVEALPAGIYLLRVVYAEGIVTRRIQVQ
ncbi:T9SS type A sorting domain-containing protein [Hymenobacter aquaticus]|uniref:T9SS type A sorting domain-containing protein n=1 Tax=Hymenobacter aquaticus TaxID=1867101 RepID=A0A4Z0Q5D4_9BACT|nr:T9SS type A sorting domain-containing protein [Hymenobacter aquaticus]TGE24281.1 T9SS type A sorting domain-containing protein [Hymenobacter aquaticus]